MDTSDDVNILKILFEEDDDDVLFLYLSEKKEKAKINYLQREVRKVIIKY
jgi:hypothetical protein